MKRKEFKQCLELMVTKLHDYSMSSNVPFDCSLYAYLCSAKYALEMALSSSNNYEEYDD